MKVSFTLICAFFAPQDELVDPNDQNVEGLVYADLELKRDSAPSGPAPPPPGGAKPNVKRKPEKPVVVRQNEPATDYAVIDFGKTAAPPAEPAGGEDGC